MTIHSGGDDPTNSVYKTCVAAVGQNGTADETLECITTMLQAETSDVAKGLDVFFLIWAAALMFFMQAGFAVLCAGCVRRKNAQNTMLKNLLDACGAALGFWSVGYAFAYGGSEFGGPTTFIGGDNFFMMGMEGEYASWLYQFAFAATSATIVAGTLAERCQMAAYLCYSLMLTGFVYPVVVHAVWSVNGFLSPSSADPLWGTGVIDFAGSGVVHVTGGFTALIATKILGARKGRFEDDRGNPVDYPKKIKGHSVSLQVLGTFILWFAWYGFNAGSTNQISSELMSVVASTAAVSTTLAAASGCISSLFGVAVLAERRTGEIVFDISAALNGCLAGLVSITGACAVVEPWAAVVVGLVAGVVYACSSELLVKMRIDDAVDAIPVHLFGGLWGMIAVGLFASPGKLRNAYGRSEHVGWFYSWGRGSADAALLGVNVVGLLFILGWVLCTMLPFFFALGYLGWFRSDPLEEIVGLDISYHGGSAYHGDTVNAEHLRAFMLRKSRRRSDESDQSHLHSNSNSSNAAAAAPSPSPAPGTATQQRYPAYASQQAGNDNGESSSIPATVGTTTTAEGGAGADGSSCAVDATVPWAIPEKSVLCPGEPHTYQQQHRPGVGVGVVEAGFEDEAKLASYE
mmetsp:Transcript_3909/g.10766  ORF Transcript_3909/g.10766 Transcript_3909/m.10766 type:complete len:631 (-) Transcript_3909:298-2190(-)